jgi:hypothetical protein
MSKYLDDIASVHMFVTRTRHVRLVNAVIELSKIFKELP